MAPDGSVTAPAPVHGALEQAEALVGEGRHLDAIASLVEANRAHRSGEIERRLVALRHEAFAHLPPPQGLPSWPREVPDTFPGVTVPEVAASDLTSDLVGGGILHHGCLIVRGLTTPARAEAMVADIDRVFDACDARNAGAPVEETMPWYAGINPGEEYPLTFGERWWIREGGGVWTADSPRMMFDLLEVFDEAGLAEVLTGYLGERPALSVKKCTLRRVPITTGTDWHQDGAFLGDTIRTVNVWLSLSHCGVDAPSLDLVPRRIPDIVETGSHGAQFDWSVGPGMVDIVADGVPIERPVFAPGDAVLFDERFLHRTGVSEGMTKERYAIESWFFAPSTYPHAQIPLVF